MDKIASPQDLKSELQRILAYSQGIQPSRQVIARQLLDLSIRVSGLDVGRGTFTDKGLKFHHFSGSLQITDMSNAGKRGKKVRQLSFSAHGMMDAQADPLLEELSDELFRLDYDAVKRKLEDFQEEHGQFKIYETTLRGVDVEPMGTKITLKNKLPDGTEVEITSSPGDFLVRGRWFVRPGGDEKKAPFAQDTLYYPKTKRDASPFYAWLKDNLAKASKMTILDLRSLWDTLGVKYDYH